MPTGTPDGREPALPVFRASTVADGAQSRRPGEERTGCRGPSEIWPGFLFVGTAEHALSEPVLSCYGITHVLTVAGPGEIESLADARTRLHLKVRDYATENIAALFPQALEFLDAASSAGGEDGSMRSAV